MKSIKPVYRRQDGFTLIYVLCFLFLAIGLVVSILDLSTNHRRIAQRQTDLERAMYVGEAGLELGASYLASNLATIATVTCTNGSIGQGSFSCMITQLDYRTYQIVSTGIVNNVTRVVRLQKIYEPTYAEFSLWSGTNGVVWFTLGEVFTGRVHSDTPLYFMNPNYNSGPVFSNVCSTFADCYYSEPGSYQIKNGSTNGITFCQGLLLNSYEGTMADVDFNSTTNTSLLNQANNNGGLVLQGTTTITFNGGTVSIVNSRHSPTNFVYTPNPQGLIYIQKATSGTTDKAGRAYLQGGSITGQLTIATEEDAYINGSILYANDPRTITNSTDALGIVSGLDIVVGDSAPNNLEIDAAMMATGILKPSSGYSSPFSSSVGAGAFGVDSYSSGSPRGILTLYGGIVQENRGPVGTLDGNGNIATGYSKNYSYDKRFIDNPPPFYPAVKNQFQWSNWQEGPN